MHCDRSSPVGGRNASTIVKPYFDEPVCTVQVDVYFTLPVLVTSVFLKMSPRVRNVHVEDTVKLN